MSFYILILQLQLSIIMIIVATLCSLYKPGMSEVFVIDLHNPLYIPCLGTTHTYRYYSNSVPGGQLGQQVGEGEDRGDGVICFALNPNNPGYWNYQFQQSFMVLSIILYNWTIVPIFYGSSYYSR